MRRKLVSLLLCLVCAFGFTGCKLFDHNYEKDYQRVIVRIAPYTETREVPVLDDNGNQLRTETKTFTTKEHVVYKTELVSLLNSNLQNFINSGYTAADAVESIIDQLVAQRLVLNEAEILIYFGDIFWGDDKDFTNENIVQKSIYASIDSQLASLKNTIRKEQGETVPSEDSSTDSDNKTSTTYPVPEEEDADEVRDTEAWQPDKGRHPGLFGDDNAISLDNEAMRRLLELFRENIEADFRFEAESKTADKQACLDELAQFVKTGNDGKYAEVYLALGKSKTVDWLIGQNARDNQKITLLQKYLTDSASVSFDQVSNAFENAKKQQLEQFADDSAYNTAITGTDPVLYYANDNYVFVKHILIPFSDEQKAAFTAWKDAYPRTPEEQKAYRKQMVNGIKAYAHVEGEDDKSRVYTAEEIFREVRNTMKQYAATPQAAASKFDEFIFKYNTDPGIFNNETGYAVKYDLKGDSETYMKEFAEASRAFRDDGYKIGEVYDEMVITDYGVHIMYYADDLYGRTGETKSLTDYTSVARKQTYYEVYEEKLLTALQNAQFNEWRNTRISYYENLEGEKKVIFTYDDRYSDLTK